MLVCMLARAQRLGWVHMTAVWGGQAAPCPFACYFLVHPPTSTPHLRGATCVGKRRWKVLSGALQAA